MEHAKVLVVDDEEPIRRILCEILEREMISSDTASDGYEAIRKLEENDYDVVLLDLNMPGMSGLDVLRSICDLGKPVEVIIVTGYGSLDSAIEAVRYRAYDYVLKPFEATQITKIVKNALEKRRLMKDLERAYRYTSSLLKSSADVIISTDMSKTVVIFNPAAEKLTGYAAEEVIGRSVDMLLPEGRREEFGRLIILYGCKTPSELLFRDELESLKRRGDAEIHLAVDRTDQLPWREHVGVVTDLVDTAELDVKRSFAVACGPPVFYKHLLDKLVGLGYGKDRIFVSLERRMECGVGKCGHCAVGYTFTCLHGPVFSYWDAINLPELIYT